MSTPTSQPSKSGGQFHSIKGNVVEAVGNLTGSADWKASGKKEHAAGEAEYNAAKAEGFVEGVSNRVGGRKDAIVGAITGDETQQAHGNVRQKQGEAQQRANE